MKTRENLITEFLQRDTSAGRRKQIQVELENIGVSISEVEEMKKIYDGLDFIASRQPSEKMTANFYEQLENYKTEHTKNQPPIDRLIEWITDVFTPQRVLAVSYSLILLIIGWGVGYWSNSSNSYKTQITQMSSEIREMKEIVMLNMLNESSPSERIKAVKYTDEFRKVDYKIIDALLTALNTDPNANVRLVIVNTLAKFADETIVRYGLIQSINKQESPIVQLALADLMVKLHEKNSVTELKKLLERRDLNHAVRNKIQKSIYLL